MYQPKIAIIIPTILRDDLLIKSVTSILESKLNNYKIIIIDQNPVETYSEEKKILYSMVKQCLEVIKVPFNSGISYCRNKGVERAYELKIPYTIISADSILFNESMNQINELMVILKEENSDYDLLGLQLDNRIGWEGKLDLIKDSHFLIDFIDKTQQQFCINNIISDGLNIFIKSPDIFIHPCDIVRNFFIAKTNTLYNVEWDVRLKMCEHEKFFWEYKQAGYKVGWTIFCSGAYIGEISKKNNSEYAKLRSKNFIESKNFLLDYYNLKSWVKYLHLERTKQ